MMTPGANLQNQQFIFRLEPAKQSICLKNLCNRNDFYGSFYKLLIIEFLRLYLFNNYFKCYMAGRAIKSSEIFNLIYCFLLNWFECDIVSLNSL